MDDDADRLYGLPLVLRSQPTDARRRVEKAEAELAKARAALDDLGAA